MKNFPSQQMTSMILKSLSGPAFTPIGKEGPAPDIETRMADWGKVIFKALTTPGALDASPCPECSFVTELWSALKEAARDDDSPAVKKCVSKKIPILVHEGYEGAQAVAIAFSYCRKRAGK